MIIINLCTVSLAHCSCTCGHLIEFCPQGLQDFSILLPSTLDEVQAIPCKAAGDMATQMPLANCQNEFIPEPKLQTFSMFNPAEKYWHAMS